MQNVCIRLKDTVNNAVYFQKQKTPPGSDSQCFRLDDNIMGGTRHKIDSFIPLGGRHLCNQITSNKMNIDVLLKKYNIKLTIYTIC